MNIITNENKYNQNMNIITNENKYNQKDNQKELYQFFNDVHFRASEMAMGNRKNIRRFMGTKGGRMKNNVVMRKHHRIQQPGHDVQRFGGK